VSSWRRFKLERKPRERWKLCVDCGHHHLTNNVCTECTCGRLNCASSVAVAPPTPETPKSAPRLRGTKRAVVVVDELADLDTIAPTERAPRQATPRPAATVVRLPLPAPAPLDVRRMTRDEIARLPPGPQKREAMRQKAAIEAGVPGVVPRRPR
jgi:hypothetical protein